MTNELISNPSSKADEICNYIIWLSNEFAKFIGISYSELWIIIMLLVCGIIMFYIVLTYSALYLKRTSIIKRLFLISTFVLFAAAFIIGGALMEFVDTL